MKWTQRQMDAAAHHNMETDPEQDVLIVGNLLRTCRYPPCPSPAPSSLLPLYFPLMAAPIRRGLSDLDSSGQQPTHI